MAEELNGIIARAKALAQVVNSLLVGPAVLLYVILVLSGYVPFRPLDDIQRTLVSHDGRVTGVIQARTETERKLGDSLDRFAKAIDRMERRDRLTECSRITDTRLRERCLE